MAEAIALPRRRRRRRRRPRGFEWFTLLAFLLQLFSFGIGVWCVTGGLLPGSGAAGAVGAALLLSGSAGGATLLWYDQSSQERGVRSILYAWLVGEPE